MASPPRAQSTNEVFMISPTAFESNAQATSDNHFMSTTADATGAPASAGEPDDKYASLLTARVVADDASVFAIQTIWYYRRRRQTRAPRVVAS